MPSGSRVSNFRYSRCSFVRWSYVVKSDRKIKESLPTQQTTFDNSSRIHRFRESSTFVGGCRAGSVRHPLPSGAASEFFTIRVVSWVWCCKVVRIAYKKSYLVDPASSHMLVSKIKPCMSKYKQLYTVKLRTAHYISNNLFDGFLLHG